MMKPDLTHHVPVLSVLTLKAFTSWYALRRDLSSLALATHAAAYTGAMF